MDRRELTFAQAEGASPLPTQLKPRTVSKALRAQLWYLVHSSVHTDHNGYLSGDWLTILRDEFVYNREGMIDNFSRNWRRTQVDYKEIFERGNYVSIFDFLQYIIRHRLTKESFIDKLRDILIDTKSYYRLVGRDTIAPMSSDEELKALEQGLSDLSSNDFGGGKKHLRDAAQYASEGKWSDSIRESIHAVESVARSITGEKSLEAALRALEDKASIHNALKRGFAAIYGYSSDEKGIRHPLLESDAARVDGVPQRGVAGGVGGRAFRHWPG